jgi:hypothetical protein
MTNIFHYSKFMGKDTFFRVQKMGWAMIGFWIASDSVSRVRFSVLMFNCMEVLIYGIFQLLYCFDNRDNLKVFLDGLTPFLTQVPCILRVLILVFHRKELKQVLDYLKNIFENCKKFSRWR